MTNEIDQSDEIFALQSICDSLSCDLTETPYRGSINIELFKVPKYRTVEFMCNDETFSFFSLPPLILDFSFPSDYPSTNPPSVGLKCLWLTPEELDMLSEKLNEIWNECMNSVIMYTWFNFLQYEALEFLGVTFPRSLNKESVNKMKKCLCAKEEVKFNGATRTCPICSCKKPGEEFKIMTNCEHFFCKGCLMEHVRISGTQESFVKCPNKECTSKMAVTDAIEVFLTKKEFEDYDLATLRHKIGLTYDIHFCPRPTCGKPIVAEREKKFGVCNVCQFAFCFRCRLANHGVDLCGDLKREETIVNSGCKRIVCPSCKAKNEKNRESDKIVCVGCDKHFCGLCKKVLLSKFSDKHFQSGIPECLMNKSDSEEKNPKRQKKPKKQKKSKFSDD